MKDENCWQAVLARDVARDGDFFYGVLTTGVYCRPSCASRLPLKRNVRYYANAAGAERAGLRPCKRCHPLARTADARRVQKMRALCRYIEAHSAEALTLEQLGAQAHLSPFHLQRSFKAVLGVSPKQYADACRLHAFKRGLRSEPSVTRAIHDAGYGSASRVYGRMVTRLGMTPKEYRAGGAGIALSYASARTPLGLLLIGATDRGLCFVQFGDDETELLERLRLEFPGATLRAMEAQARGAFAQWMRALTAHLSGAPHALDLPVDLRGTAFQLKVWEYLLKIPSGELRSYSEVAVAIGHPKAVRAVASACAANRVALVIPCHRVIRGDGGLGGYRWGLERKRALIDQERALRAAAR